MIFKTDSSRSLSCYLSYVLLLFLLFCTPTTIDCSIEQYRRCRDLNRASTGDESASSSSTIPIVSPLQGFYDSKCEVCPNTHQATEATTLSMSINRTRAVVFATSASDSFEKALTITAGLLSSSSKSHVTIITGPNMPDPGLIRQVLFQHVPCDQHLVASMLLDFKQLHVDATQLPCPRSVADPTTISPGDVLLCNIQNAEVLVNAITNVLHRIPEPSVFLMEATFIAGILVAEKFRIPSVLMVENADVFLRHVLGAPKLSSSSRSKTKTTALSGELGRDRTMEALRNLFGLLNPRSFYRTISSGIQDRLNSLDLTSSFIALNRIRARLKLRRLRLVSDMWSAGGNIMLTNRQTAIIKYTNPKKTIGSDSDVYSDRVVIETVAGASWRHVLPNLYTFPDPLLPPCIACTNEPITTKREKKSTSESKANSGSKSNTNDVINDDDIPVIVLSVAFRNDEKGRSSSRRLMMSFWLARQSIKKLSKNPCNTTTVTDDTSSCWNGPVDFQVVRPGTMPEVVPPGNDNIHDNDEHDNKQRIAAFVTSEETTYLDTLSRHQPVAMVSVCDNTNTWTQALGPPVLCLDTAWPARKIASSIVSTLRNLNSKIANTAVIMNSKSSTGTNGRTEERNITGARAVSSSQDGLQWIVLVLERLSSLREEREHEWDSGWKMRQDVLRELQLLSADDVLETQQDAFPVEREEDSFRDLIALYSAWIILISSIMYVPVKNYAMSFRFMRNRFLYSATHIPGGCNNRFSAAIKSHENLNNGHHQFVDHNQPNRHPLQEHLSLAAIGHELYFRLSDLEQAWNMFISWIKDTINRWQDNRTQEGKHSSTVVRHNISQHSHPDSNNNGSDILMNNSSSNGSHRKRKSLKKRH